MSRQPTIKQERFAQEYVACGNASEAYRRAYDAENMSAEAIHVEACKLAKHPNVAIMVQELRDDDAVNAKVTVEGHLRELQGIRDKALEVGNYSAAVRAEELRGKVSGFYFERIIDERSRPPTDPASIARAIAGDDDELYRRILTSVPLSPSERAELEN